MEIYNKGDHLLFVKNGENNLEMRNGTKSGDNESTPICKLNDFFRNNIDIELSKISILQLENCDLNEIPPAVQKLNLKQLILAHNKLREVPSCLYSSLDALELLDLSHNFIESFDIEPACSCTIVTLKLNDNKIRNLPHWILTLRCPKLTEIVYSNNHVTDLKASHQLNIKKLEMSNCQLMDIDFPFFKSIKTLEHLDVSNQSNNIQKENNFKNIDNLFVKVSWKHFKVLNLSNLSVSVIPEGIFWLTSLTELYLNNCDLSWIPSEIQYLTNLKILDVSNNTICSLPEELSALKDLGVIKAPFNKITSLAEFSHNIHILDLYNNSLESYPACANNAKFVDLEQNYFETETCDNYETKRDQFRQMFSHKRFNGPKELLQESYQFPPDSYDDGCSDLSSDSESNSVDYLNENYETESDNWDEDKPVIFKQKNPEITSSDDEWQGKVEIKKRRKVVKASEYDPNEEWIFSDADE